MTLLESPHVGVDVGPDVRAGIRSRRTFRTFEHRPVPAAVRHTILDAARCAIAPGDANLALVVIDDHDRKRELYRLTRESKDISNHWEGLFRPSGLRGYVQYWPNTPFCVAVCAEPGAGARHIHDRWNHQLAAAAAIQNLALAARSLGLALVMYTHFSQEKLQQFLDAPFERDAAGVMGIGYPDLARTNPEVLAASLVRLPLAEIVASDRHGRPDPEDVTAGCGAPGSMPELLPTMLDVCPVTRFRDTPVDPAHVFEILEAARWAPSAGNFQPVRYIVLRDRERLTALEALAQESRAVSGHWFPRYRDDRGEHPEWTSVPLAIAVIADPSRGGPHIHGEATHIHAGGLAAQNMAIVATALGLGTTLVTHWIEEKVKVLVDCPRSWDLVGVMPFGVPADTAPRARPRLETTVYQEAFGRPWDPAREHPFR